MRKRAHIVVLIFTVTCTLWLSACASDGASSADDVKPSDAKHSPIDEAVTVPTAEIMPEEKPAILQAAEAPADAPAPLSEEQIMDQYRIGPTDVLGFRSFDDESLNMSVVVRHDGMISLPWIPDLKVGGHTRDEATAIVKDAYKELYYDAEVSLQIVEATSKTYTVMGDVTRPAEFPYLKPITLLDAIIASGGLRVNQRGGDSFVGGQGQLVKAFIIRGAGEGRTATEYDLRHMEKGGSHDTQTQVLPGDTIFIPEGLNLAYVLGEVGRPGIQPLSEGMSLLQLLAAVGGFSQTSARLKQVVLIREVDDSQSQVTLLDVKTMLRQGGDIPVQPGDIVFVPRKRLLTLGEFISRSTGLVTPIIGVTTQALGLYTQAYDAYYADDRADLLYNSTDSNQIQTNLQLLEAIRQVGAVAGDLTGN